MEKSVLFIVMLFPFSFIPASAATSVNTPPVVAITSPANQSTFTAGSDITITASASESLGTIREVFFYEGTYFLGASAVSPYTYTWTNVPAGVYCLTVEATDSSGGTLISGPVNIAVNPATSPVATSPAAGLKKKK